MSATLKEEIGQAFLTKDRGVMASDATGILSKSVRKRLEANWKELRGANRR